MKIQASTTQEASHHQTLIKRIFLGCIRFLGTFLFIFFMTRNLLDSMGVNALAHKQLTYIVILSSFICVTIGANYWYGDRVVQWRSYCMSSIITFILYFAYLATSNSTNYPVDLLQFAVIASLPVISTVFSIWKLKKGKKVKKDVAVSDFERKPSKHSRALANTVRFVALISFCSVFLENAQRILLLVFDPELRMPRMFPLSEAVDVIVAAYAIWLLICFARKEFAQLSKQEDGEKGCAENKSGGN
ncbi:MAG: hypothetical protein ABFC31_10805 [Clostridiaceae bacterium]